MREHATRRSLRMVTALAISAGIVALRAGVASAGGQVTIPSGNPSDNQTLTVSGSGLPTRKQTPTGVQILECSDPGGKVGRLPTDASGCDGATINPLPVNTDANGNFSTRYTFYVLNNAHGASNIQCDATHFCVLWVGVDYNQGFLGPHAFSRAFEIGGSAGSQASSSNAIVIALPIAAAAIGVAALITIRRRRSHASTSDRTSKAGAEKLRA